MMVRAGKVEMAEMLWAYVVEVAEVLGVALRKHVAVRGLSYDMLEPDSSVDRQGH